MLSKERTAIILFIFISVFEPPFLPVPLIYIQGTIELLFLLVFRVLKNGKVNVGISKSSGMTQYFLFIIILWTILSFNRLLDITIFNGQLSASNWLKLTNQFLLLTFIEFMNIHIILEYFEKHHYSMNTLFNDITNIGALQGFISLLAFLIPALRSLLLKFAGDMYTNSWLLERRGYGFSQSLLDGFGYGMGLIAGLLILRFRMDSLKHFIIQTVQLILVLFAIVVNSRTGLIIFFVAVIMKITLGSNLKTTLLKIPVAIITIGIIIYFLIPLVNLGMESLNTNVNWIASDVGGLIKAIFPSADINTTAAQAQTTSNPYYTLITNIQLPDNTFQLLFGKGWQVYEGSQFGYRSDNGYVNMLWMVGVIGTIVYYVYNLIITSKLFKLLHKNQYRLVLAFNYIALLVYSIKGRPIGYSSGIVLFYLIIFGISFFSKEEFFERRENHNDYV